MNELQQSAERIQSLITAWNVTREADEITGVRRGEARMNVLSKLILEFPAILQILDKFLADCCDHEDPDNSGQCIKCQTHTEDWQ